MASTLKVDNIIATDGTTAPITLSGDTATLSGTGVTFPAGHIISIQEFTNSDTTDTWTSTSWRSVVSGAYALSNSSNKLLFHVQASIGKSLSTTGLYGQITSKVKWGN